MNKFLGKTVVITGGSKGMGMSHAERFLQEGANVVIGDKSDAIKAAAALTEKYHRKVIGIKADVSCKTDCENLMLTAYNAFGSVDILINNAGILKKAGLSDVDESVWDEIMSVNVKGTLFCTQAAVKYMVDNHYGKIINISSIAGLGVRPPAGPAYGVSKAAMVSLTRFTAMEYGKQGINCNAVAPGMIVTPMTFANRTEEEIKQLQDTTFDVTCSGRCGNVDDVTNCVMFLAADDSSYINGRVIEVDGGRMDHIGY